MENSIEDVQRKFSGTYVYADLGDGIKKWSYLDAVLEYEKHNNIATGRFILLNNDECLNNHGCESVIKAFKPEYAIPEKRYYEMHRGFPVALFRRFNRSYKVGLTTSDWVPLGQVGNLHDVLFNKELTINPEEALKSSGLVTPKIYLRKDAVYYLGKQVGNRKGRKFLVSDWILQEIKDAFRGSDVQII